jgi:hypothetical protein
MAAISPMPLRRPSPDLIVSAWRWNAPLTLLVFGMLAALVVFLIGLVVDPRVITGAPAWLKPAKFAISIFIYGATLVWMLTFITDRPRLVTAISSLVALGVGIEMVLIAMQAYRGTTSHFNVATAFDATVFGVMAGVIAIVWLLTALVAALLFRRQFASPAIVWGARLGLLISLIGMAIAFRMPQPTPQQEARMDSTGSSPIVGAHAVGVEDGGPGLPIVGWSTEGGDLRVAHFVGLHALQVLPLLGWLLTLYAPAWFSARDRSRTVGVAAALWLAITLLVFWQALRGQPLIRPDHATLTALVGALAVALLSALAILLHARWTAKQERFVSP